MFEILDFWIIISKEEGKLWWREGWIWPKTGILARYWHFWPIWSHVWPKTNANKVPRCFFCYVGTKTFASSHKKEDVLPKNWPNFAFANAFLVIFGLLGPNIDIFGPYGPMPDRKTMQTRLTYNCAHIRSTKESLTIWVKIFWLKIFWVKIFFSENLFWWFFFG